MMKWQRQEAHLFPLGGIHFHLDIIMASYEDGRHYLYLAIILNELYLSPIFN